MAASKDTQRLTDVLTDAALTEQAGWVATLAALLRLKAAVPRDAFPHRFALVEYGDRR
jgi:hypothetical protein